MVEVEEHFTFSNNVRSSARRDLCRDTLREIAWRGGADTRACRVVRCEVHVQSNTVFRADGIGIGECRAIVIL